MVILNLGQYIFFLLVNWSVKFASFYWFKTDFYLCVLNIISVCRWNADFYRLIIGIKVAVGNVSPFVQKYTGEIIIEKK